MKLTEQDLVNAHRACSDGKHEFFDKIEVVAWWPRGVCTSTSLITVPHVRYHCPNFNWEVILGFVLENRIHCWIESDDGHIVDPTYGQFDEGDASKYVSDLLVTQKMKLVSRYNPISVVLCLSKCLERLEQTDVG
jgi:hypothetical protein